MRVHGSLFCSFGCTTFADQYIDVWIFYTRSPPEGNLMFNIREIGCPGGSPEEIPRRIPLGDPPPQEGNLKFNMGEI